MKIVKKLLESKAVRLIINKITPEVEIQNIARTISGHEVVIGEEYATREGKKVTIIAFGRNCFGIQIIGKTEYGYGIEWCYNGRYYFDSVSDLDLHSPWDNMDTRQGKVISNRIKIKGASIRTIQLKGRTKLSLVK